MRRFSKMSAFLLAAVMTILNANGNVYADNVSSEELLNEWSENVYEGELTIEELEQYYEDVGAEEAKIDNYSELKEFIMNDKMNMIESYEYMLKEETDPIAIEEIQNKLESLKNELAEYSISSISATTNNLPSNYDLSTNSETSKYFPAIKNQGSQDPEKESKGSCQFFAMYYYMFSFEANKLNNKDSKVLENCYSPEWGYVQYFHNRKAIIDSLRNFGAVKWYDFEYTGELEDDLSLSDIDENALLEALKTRLVDYRTFKLDKYLENSIDFDDNTFIYNGKSELLNFI